MRRSSEQAAAREAVLDLCRRMSERACASPLAFVTVLQLAEEDAEWDSESSDVGGQQRHAALGTLPQRFLLQFPW